MKLHGIPRRDKCMVVGHRAERLTDAQAARAWKQLAWHLAVNLSSHDVPKFCDLLTAIREATLNAINETKR